MCFTLCKHNVVLEQADAVYTQYSVDVTVRQNKIIFPPLSYLMEINRGKLDFKGLKGHACKVD